MNAKVNVWPRWVLLAAFLAGCAAPGALFGETTGEKIRKVLANIDRLCRERKIGPYLDRADPEYQQKARLGNCDILRVKPFDLNEILATPEGKFAYSIRLPAPLDKPRVNRKDFLFVNDYFQALCQREAGEYIFKQVEGVDGIRVFRTPLQPSYSIGPLGYESGGGTGGSNPEDGLLSGARPNFAFAERPIRTDERRQFANTQYLRFVKDPNIKPSATNLLSQRGVPISELTTRYGYIWRGTEELNDRENGIVGGDIIVFDFQAQEVLAISRDFLRYEVDERTRDSLYFHTFPCQKPKQGIEGMFLKRALQPIIK